MTHLLPLPDAIPTADAPTEAQARTALHTGQDYRGIWTTPAPDPCTVHLFASDDFTDELLLEAGWTRAEPVLRLHSACLLSKYGFGDGDEPDAWLDWCDERDIDYNAWDWHPILRRLVREHLLPKLDQQVEVYDIETIHNPIRASTVDGIDIDDRAENGITLTPESVDVPYSEVLRIATEEAA